MAKYIDKSALVAEIEKRIKGLKDCHADTVAGYAGEISGLERLLSFLNTLEVKEVKEEPVNEDLEDYAEKELHKASVEYAEGHVEYWQSEKDGDFNVIESDAAKLIDAFKEGAEWMAKQGETLYDTINVDGKNQRWLGENLLQGDYNAGQAVIVQIRKV